MHWLIMHDFLLFLHFIHRGTSRLVLWPQLILPPPPKKWIKTSLWDTFWKARDSLLTMDSELLFEGKWNNTFFVTGHWWILSNDDCYLNEGWFCHVYVCLNFAKNCYFFAILTLVGLFTSLLSLSNIRNNIFVTLNQLYYFTPWMQNYTKEQLNLVMRAYI